MVALIKLLKFCRLFFSFCFHFLTIFAQMDEYDCLVMFSASFVVYEYERVLWCVAVGAFCVYGSICLPAIVVSNLPSMSTRYIWPPTHTYGYCEWWMTAAGGKISFQPKTKFVRLIKHSFKFIAFLRELYSGAIKSNSQLNFCNTEAKLQSIKRHK